jgi:hypothetical protein
LPAKPKRQSDSLEVESLFLILAFTPLQPWMVIHKKGGPVLIAESIALICKEKTDELGYNRNDAIKETKRRNLWTHL